jgi:hypothetical protein
VSHNISSRAFLSYIFILYTFYQVEALVLCVFNIYI